jgi:5'-3' exoribonuclease 2
MGIPVYYRKLIDQYAEVVLNSIDNVADIYFDFNGIAHWAAGKTAIDRDYTKKHHDSFEDAILRNIKMRIDMIIEKVSPKQVIGFFVDGPAVKAKMRQQLQRRAKGPFEQELRDKLKESLTDEKAGESYNRNSITPGTQFMNKLNKYLDTITSQYPNHQIIISDSNDPGEGEHKMFNFIKRNRTGLHYDEDEPSNTQKIVIVGLDADLIMLSLVSHMSNIYLMRESTERGVKDADNIFSYLDTNFFRMLLVSDIRSQITTIDRSTLYQKATSESIIDDYIFMCFLLGNDFLPHSPTLSIRHGGVQQLIQMYVGVFNETGEHLVTVTNRHDPDKIDTQVNYNPVNKLIALLGQRENQQMSKVYNDRCKLEKRPPRNPNPKGSALDDEYHKLFYMPAYQISNELDVQIDGNPGWKVKYFDHVLEMKRTQSNIDSICHNYLVGLDWVLKYYYTEKHSWGWSYNYVASPLFQDVSIYLNKQKTFPLENKSERRMIAYSPFSQLLMVLPKVSSNLLPKSLGNHMINPSSPIGHYYPEKFRLNMFFHVCFYEAEPRLPNIDEKKIETVVNNSLLSPEEKKRNSFSTIRIIQPKGNLK